MKTLRKTIKRLIIESLEHPCDDFIVELEKRFKQTYRVETGDYRLSKVFPDGCEVHFEMDALEGKNVYLVEIETIGDDCVKKGYARETLQSIFDLADEMDIWILGEADPFRPTQGSSSSDRPDKQELMNFYRSMGVRIVDGGDLERAPQKP
tara:strand:- start:892 stop:1344 length:453 start_codon:yes stop_codon:yes gene_type:complete